MALPGGPIRSAGRSLRRLGLVDQERTSLGSDLAKFPGQGLIGIQRRNAETAARDMATRATEAGARRLRWLIAVAVLLWLAAVVVVLVYA